MLVDDDTVIDGEPGLAGEFGIGNNPDADEDQIGRQASAVRRLDAGHPAIGAKDPGYSGTQRNLGAPANMRIGKELRGLRRYHSAHWLQRNLDDVDIGAARDRDRGKFEADEAGADNDDVMCLIQSQPQRIGIGEGSQRQHAIELSPRDSKRTISRTRGEDEMVPVDLAPRG